MKTTLKVLLGLLLIGAVSGCCCCGGRGFDTCWTTDPGVPVAGTMAPPQVTLR